jgi:hypothetical protein
MITLLIILSLTTIGWEKTQDESSRIQSINEWSQQTCFAFDSSNVQFIGNWPFGASFVSEYDPVRKFSFLSSGGGVYVLNCSNPSSPELISENIHTRGFIRGLFYDPIDEILYIAAFNAGLEIWDVSVPDSVKKLGCYYIDSDYLDVHVSDGLAYLSGWYTGLHIIDVSDPANLYEVGYCSNPAARSIFVLDTLSIIANQDQGLIIINSSNPSAPYVLGTYGNSNMRAIDVVAEDTLVYLVGEGPDSSRLWIFDISNPASPVPIGISDYPENAKSIFVYDSLAYVCDLGTYYFPRGFHIIDVSDPTTPTELFYCDSAVYDVCVYGNLAFFASPGWYGLRVFDVSVQIPPIQIGQFETPMYAYDVFVQSSLAFLANCHAGLRIVDITTPSNTYEVGHSKTIGDAEGIFVVDSLTYISEGYPGGLSIFNVSNPSNPFEIGYCPIEWVAFDVFVLDTFAYLACGIYFYGTSGMRIINVSDCSNPFEISYFHTSETAASISVRDSFAYLLAKDLYIINISDPSNPLQIGYLQSNSWGNGVCVSDSFTYIAEYDGLKVVDISNPSAPQEIGYCAIPGWPLKCFVLNPFVYVAAQGGGLRIIDVSIPSNPQEVGYYITPQPALDVSAKCRVSATLGHIGLNSSRHI